MRASRLTAAHKADCLMLLGSPPDMVHSASLHRTHLPAYPYMRKIDLLKRRPVEGAGACAPGKSRSAKQFMFSGVRIRRYARSARNARSARSTAPGLEAIILHPPQKCNQNRPLFSGNTALFRPASRRPSSLLPKKGPESNAAHRGALPFPACFSFMLLRNSGAYRAICL